MSKRSWSVANAAQGLLDMNSVIDFSVGWFSKCYERHFNVSTTGASPAGFSQWTPDFTKGESMRCLSQTKGTAG
ncbi:hypothetical protein E4T38_07246 [Aureobasidium subglaciale]|nr:hypothetical protein E4T38_07246 [Aureobasidium subglaciale]KAI5217814.1 hypothetical protein E4T40_07257 [Aureobasidium subglaciale]KAI5220714.1 hypothetical protein E4T41_07411 [Aureobasidium subglaciale]KAI5258365.1 hypothetical protein E4T46_07388 [Aureobasidium subglaciale]